MSGRVLRGIALAVLAAVPAGAAQAQLMLSEVIVELRPGGAMREDIEMSNASSERLYVAAEPREIVHPGQPDEAERSNPDPEALGLLVSPSRAILEPGQHKLLRVAVLGGAPQSERVYRVAVKPVVGAISSQQSGLKLLVGYDALVLVRPAVPTVEVSGAREAGALVLRNQGNSSVEIFGGKQCAAAGANCSDLPAKRLYAGAQWKVPLKGSGPVEYQVKSVTGTATKRF